MTAPLRHTVKLMVSIEVPAGTPVREAAEWVADMINVEDARLRPVVQALTGFQEQNDVRAFHLKFGVAMATKPSWLSEEGQEFRRKFMQEELDEWSEACEHRDMELAADALVDLAYVVHGTALMMGLPWPLLWSEVQRANMAKERAKSASDSKRGTRLDVIKPEGWTPPSHALALGDGPWPAFDPLAEELRHD